MFKLQNTKLITWLLSGLLLISSIFSLNFALGATASAATDCTASNLSSKEYRKACGCQAKDGAINSDNCGVIAYLAVFIRVLSALVGVVIVIMITIGGIQYSTARDNPQATQAARMRIYNAVFALVLYLFTFALLQWLVPGGII